MQINTNISRQCVFIAGKPKGVLNDDFSEYAKMQDLLYEKNIPSFSELHIKWDDFTNDKTELLNSAFKLNVIISHMALCCKVVTLPDWQTCADVITIVGVARMLGKEVVFAETLVRNLTTNNG